MQPTPVQITGSVNDQTSRGHTWAERKENQLSPNPPPSTFQHPQPIKEKETAQQSLHQTLFLGASDSIEDKGNLVYITEIFTSILCKG